MKNTIIKLMLDNDGVNINSMVKVHVGTLVPTMLDCQTCGALDFNGVIHVVFNRKFHNKLNREERRFCILHELGHYTSTDDEGFSRSIYNEIQADSYAMKYMGYEKGIEAMQGICKKLPKEAKAEFKERMQRQTQIEWCKQVAHSNYI